MKKSRVVLLHIQIFVVACLLLGKCGAFTSSISDPHFGTNTMPHDNFRIGYVADVEGHWDYFLEYVQRSQVLDWEDHEEHNNIISTPKSKSIKFRRLKLRPNTHFVYGGDSVDKGPGDIRLCRALVNLKKRYPDNVHLLVGNRDLNKLRFSSELSDDDMRRPVDDIKRPF